jgi:hypothetical protein
MITEQHGDVAKCVFRFSLKGRYNINYVYWSFACGILEGNIHEKYTTRNTCFEFLSIIKIVNVQNFELMSDNLSNENLY